ncbi:hypothetical protein C1I98_32470 [Spongiactinospora gelatinilytica]|uniref:Uncharacterized protein n=1 Tax=Spongiactinospora gelatinilytica TaxID=2666298 RepID=A0A2W2G4G8_9ACTN|nr:hypothetical protein [Spongiactinospora gelatinilytica]PZG29077.1 hypothetical protein C1I98_32470 [Spongiactinospora gelatinilytica]
MDSLLLAYPSVRTSAVPVSPAERLRAALIARGIGCVRVSGIAEHTRLSLAPDLVAIVERAGLIWWRSPRTSRRDLPLYCVRFTIKGAADGLTRDYALLLRPTVLDRPELGRTVLDRAIQKGRP